METPAIMIDIDVFRVGCPIALFEGKNQHASKACVTEEPMAPPFRNKIRTFCLHFQPIG